MAATATATPAATLFLVPPRADRLSLGRRLVGPLLSDRPQDHALALRGAHPDVLELVAPGGKERIGIDQVREVIRLAQFSAVQADRKVCLVPRAEDLTPEAANALLKILEEPTRGMAFALLAEHTGDLLPTIVSRSRVQRISPVPTSAHVERLARAGYAAHEAAWLARIAVRPGDLDALAAVRVDVQVARNQAQQKAGDATAADLVALCLDGGPIERREALWVLAQRAHDLDPETLAVGVAALAAQERPTLFVFLAEWLAACADTLRDGVLGEPATTTPWLERACVAIEDANRALWAYAPTEAVLTALVFAFGGLPHGR